LTGKCLGAMLGRTKPRQKKKSRRSGASDDDDLSSPYSKKKIAEKKIFLTIF